MNDNKMTASEFAKWCEVQIFDLNNRLGILGIGLGSVLLYKILKTGRTKI